MKRTMQLLAEPHDRLETITSADVRRLLAETLVALVNGEITTKQADATRRDCRRITRELNRRVGLIPRLARLSRGPKPKRAKRNAK
jgi:hypothetical protein